MGRMKNELGPLMAKLIREGKSDEEIIEEVARIYNIKDKSWLAMQVAAVRKNSTMRNLHE